MSKTRVVWDNSEWDKVCLALVTRYPIQTMSSSTLMGIFAEDVFDAMRRTLSSDRWRTSMNMSVTRPKLMEHIDVVRQQIIEAEDAHQKVIEEQKRIVEDKVKAEAKAQSDIFAPVLKLLAAQLFNQLQPLIDDYISAKLGNPDHRQEGVRQEAVMSHHRESVKPRKPRVGVIGLLPVQAQDIQRDYPNLDFSFVEDGNRTQEIKAKLTNVEVVFGLTTKMPHNAEAVLKTMTIWNNYKRISGRGPGAVRRSLDMWVSISYPTNPVH